MSQRGHAALWNACDLGTTVGIKLILDRILVERPLQVWLSPPCGPYSPLQNTNQRNETQKADLQQKRKEALRVYVGAACVFHECMKLGIHCTWEMSEHCNAWRLPLLQRLKVKYSLHEAVIKGCAVNLRSSKTNQLMKKGWRLWTSHARLAEVMNLPCRCHRNYEHGKCEGPDATRSAYYTPEMCKRVAKVMCQELDNQALRSECGGQSQLHSMFGMGRTCTCAETRLPECQQVCGSCIHADSMWQLGCRHHNHSGGDSSQDTETKIQRNVQASGSTGGVIPGTEAGTTPGPHQEGMSAGSSFPPRAQAEPDEGGDCYYGQRECATVEAQAQDLLGKEDYSYEACESLLEKCASLGQVNRRRMCLGQKGLQMILGRYAYGGFYGNSRTTQRPEHCEIFECLLA